MGRAGNSSAGTAAQADEILPKLAQMGGIASIVEVRRDHDEWVTVRRLNGDQSNQGRELLMDGRDFHVYRVKLYANARTGSQE